MSWRADGFWAFQPASVNSKDLDNLDTPSVTIQGYNMRFTFCSLLVQLKRWLESAIEIVFHRCTMRLLYLICVHGWRVWENWWRGRMAWLKEWCETWEGITQFPALPQALFVSLGWSLQAQLQVWWQYLLRVILCWKQTNSPTWIAMQTQTNIAEGPGKECLWMETLLLSRRSRGNKVVNLLEHQFIIWSMENAS